MSILFLRVDEANQYSSVDEISRTLTPNLKQRLCQLWLCTSKIGLIVPRDIRRAITIMCTDVTPTILPRMSIGEYTAFWYSHATTQKYNPMFGAIDSTTSGLYLLIMLPGNRIRGLSPAYVGKFGYLINEINLQTFAITYISRETVLQPFRIPKCSDFIHGIACDSVAKYSITRAVIKTINREHTVDLTNKCSIDSYDVNINTGTLSTKIIQTFYRTDTPILMNEYAYSAIELIIDCNDEIVNADATIGIVFGSVNHTPEMIDIGDCSESWNTLQVQN